MDAALTSPERPRLAAADLASLSQQSDLHSWIVIIIFYAILLGIIAVPVIWPLWYIVLPAMFLIAGMQHALSILQHEAVHYLLFKKEKLNDVVGNILLGYPIGFTMHYRLIHLAHHLELGEEDDPDLVNYVDYPNTASFFLAIFMQNITGISALRQSLEMAGIMRSNDPHCHKIPPASRWHIVGLVVTQLVILGLFTLAGVWWLYFVLWLLPLLTLAKTFTSMRNAVEHTSIEDDVKAPFARYRTILSPSIERFFFAPFNFNYHAEHHLYPGIPYNKLANAHKVMSATEEYKKNVHVVPGYLYFVRTYMVRKHK